jgi:hypothetical protein
MLLVVGRVAAGGHHRSFTINGIEQIVDASRPTPSAPSSTCRARRPIG